MPGISISCSMPFMVIFIGPPVASGTGWPRSASHRCMVAISSRWALMIRAHRVWIDGLAPWLGAQPAITMACAWWPIMPVMNLASAAVDTSRLLSARALAMAVSSAALGGGLGVGAAADSWRDDPQAALSIAARTRAIAPWSAGRRNGRWGWDVGIGRGK